MRTLTETPAARVMARLRTVVLPLWWVTVLCTAFALAVALRRHSYTVGVTFELSRSGASDVSHWIVESVEAGGPAAAAGLIPGDELKEVEGTPADELSLPFGGRGAHFLSRSRLRAWLDSQAHLFDRVTETGALEVALERDGGSYRAALHPASLGRVESLGTGVPRLLLVVVFLLAGLLVYGRGPSEAARKAFLSFASAAGLMALAWWPFYSENVIPDTRLFAAMFAVGNLAAGLAIVELTQLLSVFPSDRLSASRQSFIGWSARAYVVLATGVLLTMFSPLLLWLLWTVGLPLVVVLLFDAYLRAPLAVNRSRMEWIFIGLAASLTLAVFLNMPRVVLREVSTSNREWNLLALLPLPITMGLAVESWRISRVNRLLESTMAVVAALLILAVTYAALFLALSHSHVPIGLYRRSVLMSGLVAGGIVVCILYLQREKLLAASRRLLRGAGSPAPDLVEMERARLFEAMSADAVLTRLQGALERLYRPAWSAAWVRGPGGTERQQAGGPGSARAEFEALLSRWRTVIENGMITGRRAVILAEVRGLQDVNPTFLDVAAAPMFDRNGHLFGLVCIGPRADRQLYDRASLEGVSLLVGKAGLLIELLEERDAYDAAVREEQRRRERLGREIHDTVGSELTNIVLLAQSFRRDPSGVQAGMPNAEQLFGLIEKRARSGLEEVRTASWTLRSQETEQDFLDWLKRYAADRLTPLGVEVDFQYSANDAKWDAAGVLRPEVRLHLSRIFQEALSNVIRHAGARRVEVRWQRGDSRLQLTVRDDGKGFETGRGNGPMSTGLENMLHRAKSLGGTLQIVSGSNGGTTIEVDIGGLA